LIRLRALTSLSSLLPALVSAESPVTPIEPPTSERPSVVLIAVSGIGTRLGCYGAPVKTPNIDRLAQLGRRFDRAYSQYPAAEASRVSLMTGWRPEKTGVWGPPEGRVEDATPLQERFRAGGYLTARVGPFFGGSGESSFRWDVAEDDPEPTLAARRAAQLIEAHQGRRLFLAAAFGESPSRAGPPAESKPSSVTESSKRTAGELPAIAVSPVRVERPGRQTKPATLGEQARRALLASVDDHASLVDGQVGVILEALERLKLWDKTVVVLLSDHGSYLGGHGDVQRKDVLFEETLRTSLIVVAPGLEKPGLATQAFAELVDIPPTLYDRAGLRRPRPLQGTSLLPLLENPAAVVKNAAFSVAAREAGSLGRSVRTDRYRYVEWPDGSEELYDHQSDPVEGTNLAAGGQEPPAALELRKRLDEREAPAAPPPAQAFSGKPPARKPNVLLIALDDLSVRLGSYGYDVKTPHIDRLAALGRRFDRAYAPVPMCSPSRMALMIGWRPERLGIWSNAVNPWERVRGAMPMQELFKAHGYYTARVGKVYHGRWNERSSWDLSESDVGPPPPVSADPAQPQARAADDDAEADPAASQNAISQFWRITDNEDADEPDGRRARRVAQLLEQHRAGPFFVAVGFAKPHLRWVAPRKYFDLYSADRIQLPIEPAGDRDDIPTIAVANAPIDRPRSTLVGSPPEFDDAARRQAIAAHYACVSFVDAQVGVILETLDRLKLWDDTIVVLLGDHGFHLGEHGLWRKDTLFEESTRTPLIIVTPRVRAKGTATRELVELLDVYPTLSDLAGLPRPAGLEGMSLVPLLEDPKARGRPAAFSFRFCSPPRLGRSVRTDRYRFTEWPDGSRELYDLEGDSGAAVNLAGDPRHAEALAEMKKRLDAGFRGAVVRVSADGGR
jgi:uncharacterized sulfatase